MLIICPSTLSKYPLVVLFKRGKSCFSTWLQGLCCKISWLLYFRSWLKHNAIVLEHGRRQLNSCYLGRRKRDCKRQNKTLGVHLSELLPPRRIHILKTEPPPHSATVSKQAFEAEPIGIFKACVIILNQQSIQSCISRLSVTLKMPRDGRPM